MTKAHHGHHEQMSSLRRPRAKLGRPGMTNDAHDFVHTFFKKGAEFTEELLKDNERLRKRTVDLEQENAELRTQLASDEAARELLKKIQQLEKDKHELLSRIHEAGVSSSRFSSRFAEVEEELSQLANLYIASYQLHSSLDGPSVVRQLRELLAQLVGASAFAVYLHDDKTQQLVALVADGGHPDADIPVGREAPLPGVMAQMTERAYLTGLPFVAEGELSAVVGPVACVPLKMDQRVVGVVVVDRVLAQKERFLPVDFELFKMLGGHAATALAGAMLFRVAGGALPEVEPFRHDVRRGR